MEHVDIRKPRSVALLEEKWLIVNHEQLDLLVTLDKSRWAVLLGPVLEKILFEMGIQLDYL